MHWCKEHPRNKVIVGSFILMHLWTFLGVTIPSFLCSPATKLSLIYIDQFFQTLVNQQSRKLCNTNTSVTSCQRYWGACKLMVTKGPSLLSQITLKCLHRKLNPFTTKDKPVISSGWDLLQQEALIKEDKQNLFCALWYVTGFNWCHCSAAQCCRCVAG